MDLPVMTNEFYLVVDTLQTALFDIDRVAAIDCNSGKSRG